MGFYTIVWLACQPSEAGFRQFAVELAGLTLPDAGFAPGANV